MGNKLGKKRQVVEERYTKPQQGLLYMNKDVDFKKVKKLILESKLAPCYPGAEESSCHDLEECPICYLVGTQKKMYFLSSWVPLVDCECIFLLLCVFSSTIRASIGQDVVWKAFVQVKKLFISTITKFIIFCIHLFVSLILIYRVFSADEESYFSSTYSVSFWLLLLGIELLIVMLSMQI